MLTAADTLLAQVPPSPRRDSLKNGTIIGAAIGAAALGGFGLAICELLKEPGDPSCWKGTLVIAGVGGGIGAAAGAGIDALITRAPAPAGISGGRRVVISWRRRL